MAADTVANLKRRMARRARSLLDPKAFDTTRKFPFWHPAMTTERYILMYQNANATARGVDTSVGRLTFTHRPGVPAAYDASEPLVTEGVLP